MGWKEDLQPASFRGVPFHVTDDGGTGGRRGTLHEFPQRDNPYFEDVGRKGRGKTITCFVIGENYIAARDALLEALETAGPGELVHPTFGRLTVSVPDFSYRQSNSEGGMCRFEISFVESGEVTYPTASIATSQQTIAAAEELETKAIEVFAETFSVEDLPGWAGADAVQSANNMLQTLEGELGSLGGVLNDPVGAIQSEMGELVTDPLALANRIFGLFNKAGAVIQTGLQLSQGFNNFDSINYSRAFTTLRAIRLFGKESRPNNLTATRAKTYDNRDALNALTRQALLVQGAGMTGVMPLPVYDDAVKLRTEALQALDDESLNVNDDLYIALMDLRAKVHNDMTSRIQDSARLREITPNEVQPALALAYDLYESVDREGEIIARNRLRHPGFVPVKKIKVLSQ